VVTYLVPRSRNVTKYGRSMLCLLKHNYCKSFYFSSTKIHSLQPNVIISLYNSFIDCLCVHVRVTDSVDANFVKYTTGIRPLLVYF